MSLFVSVCGTPSLPWYHNSDSLQPPFTNWIASLLCLHKMSQVSLGYLLPVQLFLLLSANKHAVKSDSNLNSYRGIPIQVLKMIESDSILQEQ